MDQGLTSGQELLRDTSARFIQTACPIAKVRELFDTETGVEVPYLRQAGELGWFAMLVPEELGGGNVSGVGLIDASIIAYQRGRYLQPGPFVAMNVVADAIVRGGNKAHQSEILPAIVAGELVASWVVADSNGSWETTRAVRCVTEGDHFALQGVAILVPDSTLADLLLVTANHESGPIEFLVPTSAVGLEIQPMNSLDATRRFGRAIFESVKVDESALVGTVGERAGLVERHFQVAIALTVAEMVGAMDENFNTVLDYSKARVAFGRPIGSFQAIKHLLADTSLLLEASKAAADAVVRAVGDLSDDASEITSMGKAFISDSAIELVQNCWQVFGGIGYTWDHDQHLYVRRLTTDSLLYGEASWHRERICSIHGL